MKTLKVNGRYLSWENGEPFFYLGDTAWEIFHRLDQKETERYFSVRARQGFTVVQGVALAEHEGVTTPNAYGRLPLHFSNGLPNPAMPDTDGEYSYWDHVDYAVKTAAKNDIFIALLPTWGDKFNLLWGKGPEIFTVDNAYIYGKWIADRYKEHWNIIWMLGGDRPLEEKHRKIIDAMAHGIREADKEHLITFHPSGLTRSTTFVGDADYIDFHTSQTGHGTNQCYSSDMIMLKMRSETAKPYMDSEPRYEDHPACFKPELGYYWNDDDIRQNAYWNILSGACGHTYGNHCVWSMNRHPSAYTPFSWQDVLEHPGANQIGHIKKLRMSRDYYSLCPAPELISENLAGMGHMTASKGQGYAYIYSPLGIPFNVDLGLFSDAKHLRALWFDPRTGEESLYSVFPAEGHTVVVPPTQGKGCDWVLILEAIN